MVVETTHRVIYRFKTQRKGEPFATIILIIKSVSNFKQHSSDEHQQKVTLYQVKSTVAERRFVCGSHDVGLSVFVFQNSSIGGGATSTDADLCTLKRRIN